MNAKKIEVPDALVTETISTLTSLDKESLLSIIEHCLRNPQSKNIVFDGISKLKQHDIVLSERVTLLNKIDLVSVSNMMDRVYRSIVQMTRASWHDSWEDRMEVVENLCEKLQVVLDESMKLVLQQKTDFEHVFQLFELILSKIEAMKKIEMRGSITDDFGCHPGRI